MQASEQPKGQEEITRIANFSHLCLDIGLFVLALTTIFMSVNIVALRRRRSDPLAVVSDFLSGDARQMALARGFTCNNPDYLVTRSDFCTQSNADQMYAGIYLQITDSSAQEIVLSFRESDLTLGELMLLWGTPETHNYCKALVSWPTRRMTTMVVVPRTRRVDYFAPVQSIAFSRPPVPYWKEAKLLDITQSCIMPW